MARFADLSHRIEHGMTTYPGLPGPRIGAHLTREESRAHYAPGTEFHIGRIDMVANTGTYLDAPWHRFPSGYDIASVPLHRVADVPGVRVDLTRRVGESGPAIGPEVLAAGLSRRESHAGRGVEGLAVLLHTGWARHWGTERYGSPDHPHLTAEATELLVGARPALVGIDSVNIDATNLGERPAHTGLLEAGILVIEHLRGLEQLPAYGFRFSAVPAPVVGLGSFPVRAYATWT